MTIKKRLGATLATLVLGLGGVVVAAAPAQASVTDCLSGKLCLWDDINYNGPLYMYSGSTSCYNLISQNDHASSAKNRTSRTVRLYLNANCSGNYQELYTNESWGDFRVAPCCDTWNDRVSSFKQV